MKIKRFLLHSFFLLTLCVSITGFPFIASAAASVNSYEKSLAAVITAVENLVAALGNLLAISSNASPVGASHATTPTLPSQASATAQTQTQQNGTSQTQPGSSSGSSSPEFLQQLNEQLDALHAEIETLKASGHQTIATQAEAIGPTVTLLAHTLVRGARGDDVTALQTFLSSEYPDLYSEEVTGYFGSVTEAAVASLQEKIGLEPVGNVGPKTLAYINTELSAVETSANTAPSVESLASLTKRLLNANNNLRNGRASDHAQNYAALQNILQARRTALLSAMETNPAEVLQNAISDKLKQQFSSDVSSALERRVALEGTLEVLHSDNFVTGETHTFQHLIDASGSRYALHFGNREIGAVTGAKVRVKGVQLDAEVAVDASSDGVTILSDADDDSLIASGEHGKVASVFSAVSNFLQHLFTGDTAQAQTATVQKKVAVILFNFQDDVRQPYTTDFARGVGFTNAASDSKYYQEGSFGKWMIVGKTRTDGDVYGWFTIPFNRPITSDCTSNGIYNQWADAADAVAQATGIDLTGYNIKSYWFPHESCSWSGLGYVGGNPTRSWIHGDSPGFGTVAHEWGHNFGMNHANSYICKDASGNQLPVGGVCTSNEYGDRFDTMGWAAGEHFNNYHKGGTGAYSLNWLTPQNTLTVTSGGTYTIAPIEQASAGIQSLRIPKTFSVSDATTGQVLYTTNGYYYLEYRQPYGYDSVISQYFGNNVFNGVSIRLAPDYTLNNRSLLIDTTPATTAGATPDFKDATLAVGKTFTDTGAGISITTLATSTAGVTIQISMTAAPCATANPTLSLTPSTQSAYSGQTLTYNFTITDNDSSSCLPASYSATAVLPSGWAQTPDTLTVSSLSPGTSLSGTINVTSSGATAPGSYMFGETAVNTTNPNVQATAQSTFVVLTPDTTPPSVVISKPLNGSKVPSKGKLQIAASASDASGISSVQISLDGASVKTCVNTTTCSTSLSVSGISTGTHTITATAIDNASPTQNSASASVTVVK